VFQKYGNLYLIILHKTILQDLFTPLLKISCATTIDIIHSLRFIQITQFMVCDFIEK